MSQQAGIHIKVFVLIQTLSSFHFSTVLPKYCLTFMGCLFLKCRLILFRKIVDTENNLYRLYSRPMESLTVISSARLSQINRSATQCMFNVTMTSTQTKEEIHFICFSPRIIPDLFTWEGQPWWDITREGETENTLTGDISLLECFHCMNEARTIASKETEKQNGLKRAAPNLSLLACPLFCKKPSLPQPENQDILSIFFLSQAMPQFVSLSLSTSHSCSFFPAIFLPPHYLDTLLPVSPHAASLTL